MATITLTARTLTARPQRRASAAVRRAPAPRVSGRVPGRSGWRLTGRGRLVLLLVLVTVVFVALSLGHGPAPSASTAPPAGAVATRVVVQPGQTLWAIAKAVDPEADPRATIVRLRELNDLAGDRLVAGQSLLVPARG